MLLIWCPFSGVITTSRLLFINDCLAHVLASSKLNCAKGGPSTAAFIITRRFSSESLLRRAVLPYFDTKIPSRIDMLRLKLGITGYLRQ